ncbi:XdhC/CoxI family protein [Pelagibius sp. CAU 1746]|uniref:XdhC family protein n=1 Tax=Pelagibius sp. CAU 1746 TaxID=3140370 RepID=UPI00325ABDC6
MSGDYGDLLDLMAQLRGAARPYALATVVRTVAATSAKAGAKAVVTADGEIHGWIGGGCARGAVRRAALQAMKDGEALLISVQPQEALDAGGVAAGESRGGVEFHRSACPSGGSLDIFVEPMLPRPVLVVCGASPVACAIAELAGRSGFAVTVAALAEDLDSLPEAERRITGFELPPEAAGERFIVVATQGKRDAVALRAALSTETPYVAFVGSRRKAAALLGKLRVEGLAADKAARLRSPAGLDIGAITPEEIALSIVAEVVELRRRGRREHGQANDAGGNHDAA